MKSTKLIAVSALFLAVAAGSYAAMSSNAAPEAPAAKSPEGGKTFTVDGVHSSVIFKIKHLNASNFYGRFNKVEGTFSFDGGVLQVNVDSASVDTGNAKRDEHVKSADFFSVKEFPKISFTGKTFTKKDANNWEVKGDLSFRGKTKEVTVNVAKTGEGPGMRGGTVAGLEAVLPIKRSDFGMDFMLSGLSDDVLLTVALEGGAK